MVEPFNTTEPITIAISHFVKPGKERAFETALSALIQQAKTFQGYEGIQILPTNSPDNEYFFRLREKFKNLLLMESRL